MVDIATPPAKKIPHTVRTRLISGLLILVPLWITIVVLKTIFKAMASFLEPFFRLLPWPLSERILLLISIVAFLLLVYGIGLVASYVFGRRVVSSVEAVLLRLPVIRAIYGAAKQIVDAISVSSGGSRFKSVVFVEFPRHGLWSIGFTSGSIRTEDGQVLFKVFIPTAPNPTSGFLEFVPADSLRTTSLSVEQAIKIVVSGGFLSPETMAMTAIPGTPPVPPSTPGGNPLDAGSVA